MVNNITNLEILGAKEKPSTREGIIFNYLPFCIGSVSLINLFKVK